MKINIKATSKAAKTSGISEVNIIVGVDEALSIYKTIETKERKESSSKNDKTLDELIRTRELLSKVLNRNNFIPIIDEDLKKRMPKINKMGL